jgi:hypothetical protein
MAVRRDDLYASVRLTLEWVLPGRRSTISPWTESAWRRLLGRHDEKPRDSSRQQQTAASFVAISSLIHQ